MKDSGDMYIVGAVGRISAFRLQDPHVDLRLSLDLNIFATVFAA